MIPNQDFAPQQQQQAKTGHANTDANPNTHQQTGGAHGSRAIPIADGVWFRVLMLPPGFSMALAPKQASETKKRSTKIFSVAQGVVRVKVGRGEKFQIGQHGMWKVSARGLENCSGEKGESEQSGGGAGGKVEGGQSVGNDKGRRKSKGGDGGHANTLLDDEDGEHGDGGGERGDGGGCLGKEEGREMDDAEADCVIENVFYGPPAVIHLTEIDG